MKKFILMFATLCLITFSANSQTKKGTVLLGAGSQFSETAWTDWNITPRVGSMPSMRGEGRDAMCSML